MEPKYCVLLYSKYSSISTTLLDNIKNDKYDLTTLAPLKILCIDNEKIRSRIIKDTIIKIESVPSILVVYNDGGVEKFDGINAFEWVNEIIKKFIPTKNTQQNTQTIQNTQKNKKPDNDTIRSDRIIKKLERKRPVSVKRPMSVNRGMTSIEELTDEDQEEEEEEEEEEEYSSHEEDRGIRGVEVKTEGMEVKEIQHKNKVLKKSKRQQIKEDYDDRYNKGRPAGTIRKDSSNFEIDDSLFGGEQINSRGSTGGAIKDTSSNKGKKDIMTIAQELAKSRDNDDLKNNKSTGLEGRRL